MQVISRNSKDHEHMHGMKRRHEGQVEQPGEALQIAPSLQFNPNFFK